MMLASGLQAKGAYQISLIALLPKGHTLVTIFSAQKKKQNQ